MVVIRLSRAGAKKRPFYHMVVTDSRQRRDSNYVEELGYFNPIARGQEKRLHLDLEKISYWQGVGAQLSDRVKTLVKEFKKTAPVMTAVSEESAKKATAPKKTAQKATAAVKETKTEATAAKNPVKKEAAAKETETKATAPKKTVKKTAEK